jgi:ligand-binding SRPBCC domain-containing protein
MRYFRHQFQVNAPIEKVAEFHQSTQALKQLTPPPLFVKFNRIEPMGEGSQADFTLWLGPIPIRWIAIHSAVDPLNGFTDTQVEGPFQTWIHRHSFERLNPEATKVIDEVEGQPSNHLIWGIVSRFMWLTMPILFSYRARQTRQAVELR